MATGFVFERCPDHVQRGHPERPERLELVPEVLAGVRAQRMDGRQATESEIGLIHSPQFVSGLEKQCALGEAIIDFAPTYVTRDSYRAALRAAGGTVECTAAVLRGHVGNAFAIVRPPGHHAEPQRAMGFCLFNNAAIAAAWALEQGVERVAVVDYDAHHGNGTQAAFLNEPRVAYLSTHQWGIYPGSGGGQDAPHARGRIVNIALPPRAGNRAFADIATGVVGPFIRRFRPELILVSAGFDAHWEDPLTSLGLNSAGFHAFSRQLVVLAQERCAGRIVFVLEGGYDPGNVANGVRAVFAALSGEPFSDAGDPSPYVEPDLKRQIAMLRELHAFQGA